MWSGGRVEQSALPLAVGARNDVLKLRAVFALFRFGGKDLLLKISQRLARQKSQYSGDQNSADDQSQSDKQKCHSVKMSQR